MPRPERRETPAEKRERRSGIDDPEVVLNAAARFLEVRSRSVDEVRRHLVRAGYRAELVEGAVARLTDLGMLDDAAFARMWVESRDRARPRSELALRRELALKGIERDLAAEVLDERRSGGSSGANRAGGAAGLDEDAADGPDMLAAERLLRRKASSLARVSDPRERRQRAYGLLARNGFDPDVCREATIRFLAASSEGAEE